MSLKWKVCGMKFAKNIKQVLELEPDFMGFIFYEKSPRYVGEDWDGPGSDFPTRTKKVGVFVNELSNQVSNQADRFQLDYIQLHGHESPQYCMELSKESFAIIKAVSISSVEDLANLAGYAPWVDYFLFDTPSSAYGGTGEVFDWSILKSYREQVPVFLSGGISLDNISNARKLELKPEAIDVNSRFESRPGLKDVSMLERLKNQIQEL